MPAPNPIPTKNARKFSLPKWYLPKGTINASEDELDNASSSCESWGLWCGALVIASVIAEIIIAVVQPTYDLFLELSAVTDVGIALGIVGEVLLGMRNNRLQTELRRRSNEKVAAAMDRAAKAQEALIAFRKPRHEVLTPENREKLLSALRPFAGTIFVVGHDDLDREVWDFLWHLEPLISEAGWIHADWQGGRRFRKQGWPGDHWYGVAGVMNVSIECRLDGPLEVVDPVTKAAVGLAQALQAIGIDAVTTGPNNSSIQTNLVQLLVGPKR